MLDSLKNSGHYNRQKCKEMGISPKTLHRIIRGSCSPTIEQLILICQFQGCGLKDLDFIPETAKIVLL